MLGSFCEQLVYFSLRAIQDMVATQKHVHPQHVSEEPTKKKVNDYLRLLNFPYFLNPFNFVNYNIYILQRC